MKFLILVLAYVLAGSAQAQTFTFKNDFFAPGGKDRWLTNDIRLGYGQFAIGQEMYTPSNKRSAEIPIGDRPWDGFSYLEYTALPFSSDDGRALQIRIGALGEASGAGGLQQFVHDDLGFGSHPAGWHTANDSTIGFDLLAVRKNTFIIEPLWGLSEMQSNYSLQAGNVKIAAALDQEFQRGFDVGDVELRALAGMRGELVAFNTFLNGRMFQHDSYTIDHQAFVGAARAGLEIRRGRWFFRYTYSYLTEEFKGQDGRHLFGAIEFGRRQ